MKTFKNGTAKRFLIGLFFALMMTALTSVSALAAQKVSIAEGAYYIKAVNGNAKGQVLYWNEDASDQNTSMMFEKQGGKHADYEIWYITKNRNFDDYYGIYLYKDYTGNKDYSKRIEIDNLTGRDQPYLTSTKGPHVFCGAFGNQDDAFYFVCESGNNFSTNLTIRSHDDNYTFNRHKEVKLFHDDLIYINANKDHDTSNKLWELVPVNVKDMSRTYPALSSKKSGQLTINWEKFASKIRDSKAWKNAKSVEIQCSTKKNFSKNVKTIEIKKKKLNKAKAKTVLSKLKKNTTYYIRVRLIYSKGLRSNWSKTKKIRTKK